MIRLLDYRVDQPAPFASAGDGARFVLDGFLVTGRGIRRSRGRAGRRVHGPPRPGRHPRRERVPRYPRFADEHVRSTASADGLCDVTIRHCTLVPGLGPGIRLRARAAERTQSDAQQHPGPRRVEHSILGSIVAESTTTCGPIPSSHQRQHPRRHRPRPARHQQRRRPVGLCSSRSCAAPWSARSAPMPSSGPRIPSSPARCGSAGARSAAYASATCPPARARRAATTASRTLRDRGHGGRTPPGRARGERAGRRRALPRWPPQSRASERARDRVRPASPASATARPATASWPGRLRRRSGAGADDEAELGAFHDLFQPQRTANLRARLDEYTPAGMATGIFFTN